METRRPGDQEPEERKRGTQEVKLGLKNVHVGPSGLL